MSVIEAIILGIIQGLSEFLPISSTAHLTLAGKLMNVVPVDHPEHWTAFIAVIQLGTLMSILIYFGKEIVLITSEFLRDNLRLRLKYSEQSHNSKLGWLIAVGTIPIVIIGLSFKDIIENVERTLIIKALKQTNGNRTQAAKMLNIHRRLLYSKMKDYGID